jgi:4-hydroxy-4-methyl-2-oxoglutarate aldolase
MPDQTWIEYLKSVDGPTLANAIEMLGVRPNQEGFTPLTVRDIFPDMGRMAGYAVTAQVETVSRMGEFELNKFVELYKALEAAPKPAVIALQEIGSHPDYAAHSGEIMSTIFTRLGAVGLVSDCAVRDLPEVHRLGFHYFARGVAMSHAHFRIAHVGVPVQICGMVVKPGDLLFGDVHGVLSIPANIEDRLPQAVDTVRRREGALLEFVRSPQFTTDAFGRFTAE